MKTQLFTQQKSIHNVAKPLLFLGVAAFNFYRITLLKPNMSSNQSNLLRYILPMYMAYQFTIDMYKNYTAQMPQKEKIALSGILAFAAAVYTVYNARNIIVVFKSAEIYGSILYYLFYKLNIYCAERYTASIYKNTTTEYDNDIPIDIHGLARIILCILATHYIPPLIFQHRSSTILFACNMAFIGILMNTALMMCAYMQKGLSEEEIDDIIDDVIKTLKLDEEMVRSYCEKMNAMLNPHSDEAGQLTKGEGGESRKSALTNILSKYTSTPETVYKLYNKLYISSSIYSFISIYNNIEKNSTILYKISYGISMTQSVIGYLLKQVIVIYNQDVMLATSIVYNSCNELLFRYICCVHDALQPDQNNEIEFSYSNDKLFNFSNIKYLIDAAVLNFMYR